MVLCQVISSPSSSTTVAGAAMEGQDSVYDGDPVTEALLSDECDDLSPSDPVTSTQPYTGATESQQQPEPQSGKWKVTSSLVNVCHGKQLSHADTMYLHAKSALLIGGASAASETMHSQFRFAI